MTYAEKCETAAAALEGQASEALVSSSKAADRAAGVASVAQGLASALEVVAHHELSQLGAGARSSLVEKMEQVLISAARKYDQKAAELRGQAKGLTLAASTLRGVVHDEACTAASTSD